MAEIEISISPVVHFVKIFSPPANIYGTVITTTMLCLVYECAKIDALASDF